VSGPAGRGSAVAVRVATTDVVATDRFLRLFGFRVAPDAGGGLWFTAGTGAPVWLEPAEPTGPEAPVAPEGFQRGPRALDLYTTDLEARIQRMNAAVKANDWDALLNEAHALKGSSANVGVARLEQDCAIVERCARAQDLPVLDQVVAHLRRDAETFLRQAPDERKLIVAVIDRREETGASE